MKILVEVARHCGSGLWKVTTDSEMLLLLPEDWHQAEIREAGETHVELLFGVVRQDHRDKSSRFAGINLRLCSPGRVNSIAGTCCCWPA